MRRDTFAAPCPADADRHLKLRGRRWRYVRRVPRTFEPADRRGTIQTSLRTTSLEVARLKRDELDKRTISTGPASKESFRAERGGEACKAARRRAPVRGLR